MAFRCTTSPSSEPSAPADDPPDGDFLAAAGERGQIHFSDNSIVRFAFRADDAGALAKQRPADSVGEGRITVSRRAGYPGNPNAAERHGRPGGGRPGTADGTQNRADGSRSNNLGESGVALLPALAAAADKLNELGHHVARRRGQPPTDFPRQTRLGLGRRQRHTGQYETG